MSVVFFPIELFDTIVMNLRTTATVIALSRDSISQLWTDNRRALCRLATALFSVVTLNGREVLLEKLSIVSS
jgi:hypothetical protein